MKRMNNDGICAWCGSEPCKCGTVITPRKLIKIKRRKSND